MKPDILETMVYIIHKQKVQQLHIKCGPTPWMIEIYHFKQYLYFRVTGLLSNVILKKSPGNNVEILWIKTHFPPKLIS